MGTHARDSSGKISRVADTRITLTSSLLLFWSSFRQIVAGHKTLDHTTPSSRSPPLFTDPLPGAAFRAKRFSPPHTFP